MARELTVDDETVRRHVRDRLGAEIPALLLSGSFARGEATTGSDLDLVVVGVEFAPSRARYRWEEVNVDVDLWTLSPKYVRYQYQTETGLLHLFANGAILADRAGMLADLISEARHRWNRGPAAMSEDTIVQIRRRAATILGDCATLADGSDRVEAGVVFSYSLMTLLLMACQIRRVWFSLDPRWLLRTFREEHPDIAGLIDRIERDTDLRARHHHLEELANLILAPVGGPLAYFDLSPI